MPDEATPLIYNPRSGSGKGTERAKQAVALLAARGVRVRLEATAGPGGAIPLAERLALAGEKRILVVGGDGTLSEASDGVLRSKRDVELGFLPGGTGNSFLIDFGLTTLEAAADRIAKGGARAVDAAHVSWNGGARHFIDVFGVGFMAKVCDYANKRLKWMGGGSTPYTAAVFPELVRLRSPMTKIRLDGQEHEEPLALVSVCNTMFAGGNMQFAPMAKCDDGLLDVIALQKIGRVGLLRVFPKIFKGEHIGEPKVVHWRAREIVIEPAEVSPLLGDGEVYGHTPVTIRVLPGALRALL